LPAYLLTWNPQRWEWPGLAELSTRVQSGEEIDIEWGCGNNRRICPGDRAFFLRQGVEPRGIFASGTFTSAPLKGEHWEEEKRRRGIPLLRVQVRLEALLDPLFDPILPRSLLNVPRFTGMHWNTQVSGISIPAPVAAELENAWRNFIPNFILNTKSKMTNLDYNIQ
jgi:5-methylcytosine-specific restriction enzyme A